MRYMVLEWALWVCVGGFLLIETKPFGLFVYCKFLLYVVIFGSWLVNFFFFK